MKKAISIIAVFLITLLAVLPASAYPTSGGITVVMINKADKQPLADRDVVFVKAADCLYTETDISFSLISDFSDTELDLESSDAAEQLLEKVKEKGISGETVRSDTDGKAVFAERELGAYLVYSPDGIFTPFIVFLPMVTEDGISFELTAQPKIDIPDEPTTEPEKETDTPEEPTAPRPTDSDEKLPQTGMLQLPVPILGLCGVLVFSKGFILYANSKKEEN